jgi:hypothetical protein
MKKWTHKLNREFSKEEVQMASKYIKTCSISLAIQEMQIKTTLRFHLTPVRMAIFKNTNNNKCWQGYTKAGTLISCWWEYKLVQSLWKPICRFLKKLKIELFHDPVIPLLGIYPKECKSGYNRDTCTPMFTATLFTIAKYYQKKKKKKT